MGISGSKHQQTLLTFTEAMLAEANCKPADEDTPYIFIHTAFGRILTLSYCKMLYKQFQTIQRSNS